jgi:hypothetical protein
MRQAFGPKLALGLLSLAVALGAVPAAAKQLVVTASTVPALKAGQTVDGDTTLTLPDGGKVTLIGADGKVVNLQGPYSGKPGQGGGADDPALVTKLARLLAEKGSGDSNAIGAVRAAGVAWRADGVKSLGDILAINATDGGDACLYNPANAELTHDTSTGPGPLTIHAMDGDAAGTLTWPKGTALAPWPKGLPLADGRTYVLEQAGQPSAAMVTIHVLPAAGATDMQRIAQLADAGCTEQAHLLLSLITQPPPKK